MSHEATKQLLHTEIDARFSEEGKRVIISVGNTGFVIFLRLPQYGNTSFFNFNPEGTTEPVQDSALKHVYMLGAALFAYYSWANDFANQNTFDFQIDTLDEIYVPSSQQMIDVLDNLFKKSDNPHIIQAGYQEATIDQRAFLSLGSEDPLIKALEKLANKAQVLEVKWSDDFSYWS